MIIKEINKRKNNKNLLLGSRVLGYDDGWEDTDSSYDDMDVVAM